MKKLRPAREAEVIAHFLRNEFHHHDFDRDRERFAHLVRDVNLDDEVQNSLRRALFYRRRGHMWDEIPPDTAWWLVRLEDSDLQRLCVLARTHWNKIAGGNCLLRNVVEQIRTCDFHGTRVIGGTADGGLEISDVGRRVDSIRAFSEQLRDGHQDTAVILIGVDDLQPVTILEGNHRLTAALLVSPELLKSQFRVYFGASPGMARCCWYRTTLLNLVRYARNRLKNRSNPGANIERLIPQLCREPEQHLAAGAAKAISETK